MTRGVVLRGVGLVVAVGLAGVAAWLIVTGTDSPRRVQVGVLAGLWGALLGAFAMFGPRRFMHPLEGADEPVASTGLELRTMRTELERAEEAAARRAHEAQLEHMLRREIRAAVTAEVSALRAEIAQLRSELVEKVGGQLRLERIETTRVIGSDLEALQHEVRQLKAVTTQEADIGLARARAAEAVRQIVEPARVRPVTRQTAEVEDDVQPAQSAAEPQPQPPPVAPPPQAAPPPPPAPPPAAPVPEPAPPPAPAPVPAPAQVAPAPTPAAPAPLETTGPIRVAIADESAAAPPRPQPVPAPEPVVLPLPPTPRPTPDEFADLPRLRPFTDFELDPVEAQGAAYTGRRRRSEDEAPSPGPRADGETGRRHRRAEDSDDDLLARLLAREER